MISLFSSSLNLPPAITKGEMQLLCYCARPTLSDAIIERIKTLLQSEINWHALIAMADAHGLFPSLYKSLSTHFAEEVPSAILNQLKARFHLNTIRNQCLAKELCNVLEHLATNGITAIPFKGPTLAVLAYKELAFRQFSDLDILVHEQDFIKARNLMFSAGYERGNNPTGLADVETQELARMQSWGEYSLRHPNGWITVDLHGRLVAGEFPILSANFDLFWDNLTSIPLLNTEVKTFCPENLLLYLCIHGAKDFWKKLSWIGDIAALIHIHPDLDWAQLIQRAQSLDCTQMLWLGLSLAKNILETPLPEVVEQHIQTHFKKQSLLAPIQRQVLSGIHPLDIQYSDLQRIYFHSHIIENKGDQWRYYLSFSSGWLSSRIKPNVHDQAFSPLPRQLYGLYYFVRPIRLLVEFTDALTKRFQRNE